MLARFFIAAFGGSFILLAATASLASVTPSDSIDDLCASHIDEIKNKTHIDNALITFGGIDTLVGQYKMRGLIGALANTKVEFKIEDNMFWVSVNDDKFKQVHLCPEADSIVKASNVLQLKVLNPKTPQNGKILVRAGGKKDLLYVSAHRSKWKFLKFKKLSAAEKLASAK